MHPNPAFRRTARDRNLTFARERGFGILSVNAPDGPLLSHIPFLLNAAGTEVELHLVRSNPIAVAAATDPVPAVLAVSGPDGYISPDWYGQPDQVPTWNYVAVHLRGHLEPVDAGHMHATLDRLSAAFEARLAPKRPWTSTKMSPGTMDRMMRQILPFRLRIASVDGTWKLNQNKPDAARLAAADAVADPLLAALMRDPPPVSD
ncbi:MAG: FMN-binding negative transcriptional regulator [Rhodobacteraceae bacterium]|jgi:transcriptional regulator|nr:FMN-binding negative transcriptional regulator [Paracoccaceae bacterium]